jgi:hypothetical protein
MFKRQSSNVTKFLFELIQLNWLHCHDDESLKSMKANINRGLEKGEIFFFLFSLSPFIEKKREK